MTPKRKHAGKTEHNASQRETASSASWPQGRWGDFSEGVQIYSNQIKTELAELNADNVKSKCIIA